MVLAAYPAPAWEITLHMRGPKSVDLTANSAGITHTFAATAVTTTTWSEGRYWFSLRATSGDDVREVERGTITVLPDLAAAPEGFDGRTENETALASINAVLSKRATMDQERYTINNRELWRTPIKDLLALRAFYATKVRQERKVPGSGFGRLVAVRFSK